LPKELGKLINLTYLSLGFNQLTGAIVVPIIPHNELASNLASVSGNIPVELGQLVNLKGLGLSGNQLTGALWLA